MEVIRPYDAIPYVHLPEDYQLRLAPLLAAAYEQHGPIFRAHYFGREIVFLVGPEANRFVLVNSRQKFSNYIGWSTVFEVVELFGHGLLSMDGEEHARHRKMMNPAFTISYMSRYLPLMHRIIRERTASWIEAGEVDVYEEARKITFDVAAEALTGLKAGPEVDHFRELFLALMNAGGEATSEEDYYQRIGRIKDELNALLLTKIEECRRHPTHDVFSMLVQAHDEQGQVMTTEQLLAHVNILLVAGHETSTSLGAWLLYLLYQYPAYTRRILEEQTAILGDKAGPDLEDIKRMRLLEYALSEAERLYPPVANGPRGVTEAFDFHGYHVPAGSFVFYSIVASHRIPTIFAHPDQFDPDRFAPPREEHKKHPYSLVGFGGGPRICIGINFAQVEIKVMASHILRHYQLELAPDQEITQVYGVTGMPLHGIRMRVAPLASSGRR
jgi:cytochrome P450